MSPTRWARAAAVGGLVTAIGCGADPAPAGRSFPAVLAGHAVLPARTMLDPPPDAPAGLRTSGKSARPAAGDFTPPFAGQPAQGHSAVRRAPDGSFWMLSDNGTGRKDNAADFMLYLNQYRVDFDNGEFERLATVFLRDPENVAPFPIATDGTEQRYLTGADFDPESLQFTAAAMWVGDEFGPFLLKFDPAGSLLAVFDTVVDGHTARSPDHPGGAGTAAVDRSRGLEALSGSVDGTMLYPMLEAPPAGESGSREVPILEFDVAAEQWTGRHWRYVLEDPSHLVGDFTMIDARYGLVIERDDGYGTADKACPDNGPPEGCFAQPAEFKRVYKIELDQNRVGAPVRKIGYLDLMNIADPSGLARVPLTQGVLAFPFQTIESVEVVDDRHIVVGNDNNLPYSRSREPTRIDDNELVLLEVEDLLRAR